MILLGSEIYFSGCTRKRDNIANVLQTFRSVGVRVRVRDRVRVRVRVGVRVRVRVRARVAVPMLA